MIKTLQYCGGQVLAFAEYGDPQGWPVLVQHGMIASIQDEHLFDCLAARGARIICAARPGYGESTPYPMRSIGEWGEITAVLADALGLAQAAVLGISSGAPYSYAVGRRLGGRVSTIFILSGTPALYDHNVQAVWPYPLNRDASTAGLQKLAYDLFFAHLSPAEREQAAVRDSLRSDCFGIAQDLRLRVMDWGFRLDEMRSRVVMRHSRADGAVPLAAAEITARLLPDCRLVVREGDAHFSKEVLEDFIESELGER